MRNLEWQSDAWEEYLEIQQTDITLLKKVNRLIKANLSSTEKNAGCLILQLYHIVVS